MNNCPAVNEESNMIFFAFRGILIICNGEWKKDKWDYIVTHMTTRRAICSRKHFTRDVIHKDSEETQGQEARLLGFRWCGVCFVLNPLPITGQKKSIC